MGWEERHPLLAVVYVYDHEMKRHDLKRILSDSDGEEVESLLINEEEAKRVLQNPKDRSGEELYYKYRGEEILKNSGLQYSIIRVPSLNELPSGEFSTIQLKQVSKPNIVDVDSYEYDDALLADLNDTSFLIFNSRMKTLPLYQGQKSQLFA